MKIQKFYFINFFSFKICIFFSKYWQLMGFNIPRNQKLMDNNDQENFHELFTGNIIYVIPLFQRNYKRDHKLLRPFIIDFDEIYDEIKNVHFFGAIIIHETRGGKLTFYRNIEVIDRQQRLTKM